MLVDLTALDFINYYWYDVEGGEQKIRKLFEYKSDNEYTSIARKWLQEEVSKIRKKIRNPLVHIALRNCTRITGRDDPDVLINEINALLNTPPEE